MVPSIYGENMFDDFFGSSFFGGHDPLFGKHVRNLMKTDIHETDDAKAYRFAVELPGFKKDEISLDVKDGYLNISAAKGLDKDEEDKKGRVLRQERYAGSCSRSFSRRTFVTAHTMLFSSPGGPLAVLSQGTSIS